MSSHPSPTPTPTITNVGTNAATTGVTDTTLPAVLPSTLQITSPYSGSLHQLRSVLQQLTAVVDSQDHIAQLEAQVLEYQSMLGAASLTQRRFQTQIAQYEKLLNEATNGALEKHTAEKAEKEKEKAERGGGKEGKEAKKREKEREKERERAHHAHALDRQDSGGAQTPLQQAAAAAHAYHTHHIHTHSSTHPHHHHLISNGGHGFGMNIPNAINIAGLSSLYSYPSQFESNLGMFLADNIEDPNSSSLYDAYEDDAWQWAEMESYGTASGASMAPRADGTLPSITTPSGPSRTLPPQTIDRLLKIAVSQPVQLFSCPRLGVGLELDFNQFHQLIYFQAVTSMQGSMP